MDHETGRSGDANGVPSGLAGSTLRGKQLWHATCIVSLHLHGSQETTMATTEAAPPLANNTPSSQSVSGLVSGILDDAQTLFKQQIEMLKAEVREDFRRSKRAAEFGAVGIVCATVGALGLVTA